MLPSTRPGQSAFGRSRWLRPRLHRAASSCLRLARGLSIKPRLSFPPRSHLHRVRLPTRAPAPVSSAAGRSSIADLPVPRAVRGADINALQGVHRTWALAVRVPSIPRVRLPVADLPVRADLRDPVAVPALAHGPGLELHDRAVSVLRDRASAAPAVLLRPAKRHDRSVTTRPRAAAAASNIPKPRKAR
jgi:hypothetical protein